MKQAIRNRAHGITLVEVLMSTMVVMLGILGLISLIPLGSHLAERGTRSDRIASVGRRVYREAKIRGVLNPASWMDPVAGDQDTFRVSATSLPVRQSYLIDPMFFVDLDAQRQYFPFDTSGTVRMRRLSLGSAEVAELMESRAELAFVSEDDYGVGDAGGYIRPNDREVALSQRFFNRTVDGADIPIRRQSQGTYSWAIMLVPDPATNAINVTSGGNLPPFATATDGTIAGNSHQSTDTYMMSTIIFQNRAGDIPLAADIGSSLNERVIGVDGATFVSGGGAAGEVELQTSDDAELEMKTGDWICLVGRAERRIGSDDYYWGDLFKWYRIIAMDEIYEPTSGDYRRRLTINGPDWNSQSAPSEAIYMEDVVGVYERKVRLETGSPWTWTP